MNQYSDIEAKEMLAAVLDAVATLRRELTGQDTVYLIRDREGIERAFHADGCFSTTREEAVRRHAARLG